MLNVFIVFIGGGLGSLIRYIISLGFISNKSIATMIVNIVGCFFIAIADSLFKKYNLSFIISSPHMRLLFIIGFLGGFTTYSSFLLDIFNHLNNNGIVIASLYIFFSNFLGFCAFFTGLYIAKFI